MDNSNNHDSDANRHKAITCVQTLDDIPAHITQVIMGCDNPQEITDIISEKEHEIAQAVYGPYVDYLPCDEIASLMSDILTRKNIVHTFKFGRSDEGSSHVWIEVDGIAYDPTGQGMKD